MKRFLIFLSFIIVIIFSACDTTAPIEIPEDNPTNIALAGGNFDTWVEFSQGELTYFKPAGDW